MNLSEIDPKHTQKIAITKSNTDPNGLEFELALFKAMYIYPPPYKESVRKGGQFAHAKQIYESELVERSICEAWPEYFKPLTYMNVVKHFDNEQRLSLMEAKQRTVSKNRLTAGTWQPYIESKPIQEYEYMFNDIFYEPTSVILECKVYTSESSRKSHIEKIISERSRYKSADYFILSEDKGDTFEITDCLSVTQQGYVRYHDFRKLCINDIF